MWLKASIQGKYEETRMNNLLSREREPDTKILQKEGCRETKHIICKNNLMLLKKMKTKHDI